MDPPRDETLLMKITRVFEFHRIIDSIPNDAIRNSVHIKFVMNRLLKERRIHCLPPEKYADSIFYDILTENNTDLLVEFLSVARIPRSTICHLMHIVSPQNVTTGVFKILLGYICRRKDAFDVDAWVFKWIHTDDFFDILTVIPYDMYDTIASSVVGMCDASVTTETTEPRQPFVYHNKRRRHLCYYVHNK